jgi:hypothetical protein
MKKYILLATMIITAGLGCADSESEPPCNPPTLKIVNSTSYIMEAVYLHDSPVFDKASSTAFVNPFNPGAEINVPISDGYTTYCTFIRKITSTADTDIAVTTSRPVECYACFTYTLHLLDEDFYLEEQ